MIELDEETSSYLASYSRLERSRAVKSNPGLLQIRKAAISRFAELGFPSTRLEDWKYTNVAPMARIPFAPASSDGGRLTASDLGRYTFSETECCQMVFVNGNYSPELSTLQAVPRGARVKSLAAALDSDRELIDPYLARLAGFDQNSFTALNTAFISDGAFVFVPPGLILKELVHLIFLSSSESGPTVSYPRNLVVLGAGSQATVVESYVGLKDGIYLTNTVTEVAADKSAVLDHYKLQRESETAYHVSNLQARLERGSSLTTHSISLGGALVRNDIGIVMNAEGSECALNGLYVTKGKQHVDNRTVIDHAKPNCNSRELYKGILDDRSTGVFNGKIVVRPDAQKTNAKQTNKNLLLSENALVNTTPQLEIFADDVKCTHGATIGRLNEDELFYMRSRGIPAASARTLLTYAFASEVLSGMQVKPIQCQIDLVLLNRLARLRESTDCQLENAD
jgi:Fe-S cluster assembly protein SufD